MNTTPYPTAAPEVFAALRGLDACTLANAIESFHTRLRNEGFVDKSIHCLFPALQPMLGYAATFRIRGSAPPTADAPYPDRTDWWDYVLSVPEPRVMVIEDCAHRRGLGSLLGAVHGNILRKLGCVGGVTNGSVRDIPALRALNFPVFAGSVTVSHAYIHIIEFGHPVQIGGLAVNSGELLHGDMHGVQSIPLRIAEKIPAAAARIARQEQEVIALCHSPGVSIDQLRRAVQEKKE